MSAIAKVEPLTTARAIRGPFDYRLPEELSGLRVGAMVVVPFSRRRVLGVVVGLADRSDIDEARLAAPLEALETGVPAELVELAEWVAAAYCSTPARALALVLPPGAARAGGPRIRERTGLIARLALAGELALTGGERLTPGQRDVLERLGRDGPQPAAALGTGHALLRRLEGRGLLSIERTVLPRRPRTAPVGARGAPVPALTAEQAAALASIEAALAQPRTAPAERALLLHGVTGSGKTEVYLRAAEAALAEGRTAIVLVPEIALTPQILGRFHARLGDTVAVLHSKLGAGERHDEWLRLRRGEARVCVGPRSAVFAPLEDVGLIVVDEEHDASYKHEGDPRYDAREVACRRAARSGAVLLCGSATPRPESVHRLRRVRLDERVDGRPLPPVEVLDMREARHPLHPCTREALADVRRRGHKAIVLLNRRGWSNFLSCRSCGYAWECPHCDVALVLHRAEGFMACHHCGHRERVPTRCTACDSTTVARHGAGTERVEAELAAGLAGEDFGVFRLDADTATGKGAVARTLSAFEAAPAGVLIGTQMVAKGHDFPEVTLGVVLDADATLRFPDFRAEERTFALVAQLAGRAGRGPGGGRVLVQTLAPGAPSIAHAARHDADGFLAEELARREALAYPPYADLIRIVCAAPAAGAAAAAAGAVRGRLEIPAATVLGPAPLFRLRGRERSQIVVKARDRAAAVAAVGEAVAATAATPAGRRASLSVDVDPQ